MNKDVDMNKDSLALSYKTSQKKAIQVSKVADPNNNTLNKCVNIDQSILNIQCVPVKYSNLVSPHSNNIVINIQLPYNPNALTELDL